MNSDKRLGWNFFRIYEFVHVMNKWMLVYMPIHEESQHSYMYGSMIAGR